MILALLLALARPATAQFMAGVTWTLPFADASKKEIYSPAERERELAAMKAYGANWVQLPFWGKMRGLTAVSVEGQGEGLDGRYRAEVKAITAAAHRLGLKVSLLPIVDVAAGQDETGRPVPGGWRGEIRPKDWDAWFESYRRFILGWARTAAESGVDLFLIGSETGPSEGRLEDWRRTIGEVRKVYKGPLSYSANWPAFEAPAFWGELDFIGVSSYFELSSKKPPEEPSPAELEASWRRIRKRLLAAKKRWKKPLLLTELGYNAYEGVASRPWDAERRGRKTSEAEQARCFEAFRKVWGPAGGLAGVFIWSWGKGWTDDAAYGFDGRPSGEAIRAFFAEQARR